ncbi:STM4504/CBY_0614 family protein [Aeromonas veronii]|uniref:STM4504/CBY_0614 family protein n=1 Tax=Aeromonas veronii TaxID=654 RepID=UPI0022452304|nr:hypothetical protein [Aeromonas veronii]MCX0444404.1 hypothetical protein [Aeromonas veronii]
MAILDLFSKRQRRARGEVPDVYVYDKLPRELKVQIIHIIEDAIGIDNYGSSNVLRLYEFINKALCREYGVFELIKNAQSDQFSIFNFFLQETSIERSLDVVELCFKYIGYIAEDRNFQYQTDRKIEPEDAILELNERFRENGVGFQFESGEIIRVDSEFIHSEAVKPTLAILRAPGFKGANEEFLQAHEHYRHGRHKECLVDCLKAFESTMKAICKIRQWETKPNDTAKALIATCFSNGLIPNYLETQFASIRSALESGVPTVRNKNGGHGQGAEPIAVPEYMARYALNLTATSILFIVDAHNAS